MKRVRYTKFTGDLASEMDIEDLLKALSDYLLDSGFRDPYLAFSGHGSHPRRSARSACVVLLESGNMFDDRIQQQLDQMAQDGKLDELIDKLINRMEQENYISYSCKPMTRRRCRRNGGTSWACRRRGQIRSHRQEPRFPRIQDFARSARLAGQIKFRPPRYAPLGHRRRSPRRIPALRIRRYAESRHHHHPQVGDLSRRRSDCRSILNTTTCTCISASIKVPAPLSSCSIAPIR